MYQSSVGGSKLAVDELDLTMYSGQITVLLGHNGAGKVSSRTSPLTGPVAHQAATQTRSYRFLFEATTVVGQKRWLMGFVVPCPISLALC